MGVVGKYIGMEKPIEIVYHCEKHGDTYKTLNAKNICIPSFNPCKQCEIINKSKSSRTKNKEFYYKRLQDYCKSRGGELLSKKWIRAKTLYEIKCGNPKHDPFWNNADKLINNNQWCPYCCGRKGEFEEEIENIITSKNGTLLSNYENSQTHVSVLCNEHNYQWDVTPTNLKKDRWCPICSMPFSEKVVWDYLCTTVFDIEFQYAFDNLQGKNNELLKYDFAILRDNKLLYIIEVDGMEHREPPPDCEDKNRINTCKRDKIKNKYCKDNNISLYRMPVPFYGGVYKWSYDDYYDYIKEELSTIIDKLKGVI